MTAYRSAATRHIVAFGAVLLVLSANVSVRADAAGRRDAAAEHARILEHWTPARRAAATPRDLVIDAQGRGYLRRADGSLQPYGRDVGAAQAGDATPRAKPGGSGTPPVVQDMDPDGATIGAAYVFTARVTDDAGVRSVRFYVRKGTAVAQSFNAVLGSNDTWSVSLSGFTDGSWTWWVAAKDTAGLSTTSATVPFTVAVGGGGGGGGGGGTVVNEPWTDGGAVQSAAGRIYFEMPSNSRRTRWAGYVCSGTVVGDQNTGGRSIILTAAHCVYDDAYKAFARNVLFVPDQDGTSGSGTDLNCGNDPYGCWTPNFGVVDSDWTTRTFPDNIPWDYAYYVVSDSGRHSGTNAGSDALDVAVGSLPVSFAAPAVGDVTHALGYSYSDDPNFMHCAEAMGTEGSANWWLPSCGLSGGSSGGPWVQPMNVSTGSGDVISVNSWGYTNQPGMAGPKLNGTSAACVFGMAKATEFASIPSGDGNAGISVGPSSCP